MMRQILILRFNLPSRMVGWILEIYPVPAKITRSLFKNVSGQLKPKGPVTCGRVEWALGIKYLLSAARHAGLPLAATAPLVHLQEELRQCAKELNGRHLRKGTASEVAYRYIVRNLRHTICAHARSLIQLIHWKLVENSNS